MAAPQRQRGRTVNGDSRVQLRFIQLLNDDMVFIKELMVALRVRALDLFEQLQESFALASE